MAFSSFVVGNVFVGEDTARGKNSSVREEQMENESQSAGGAVFVQTNEEEGNQVLAFRRDPDGQLTGPDPSADGWSR